MTARFAPVDLTADVSRLPDERAPGAGEAGRGREGLRRAVPAPGLGGQRGDAPRPGARRLAARPRAAALLPDQQGAVVAPRSRTSRSFPGAPTKPEQAQLLSGGRDQGGGRGVDQDAAAARSARAPPGSSPRSAADPTASSSPCRTASSTRASSRTPRSCCAKRRR